MISDDYQEQLLKRHASSPTWGSSTKKYGAGDFLGQILGRKYVQTVLDFGAGKQEMKHFLQEHAPHIEYTAYDPGIPEISQVPTGKFDMVISCDVCEHFEPHLVDETLKQMWDLTKYVMYNNIACSVCRHTFDEGPYKGQDLHLVVEPTDWWVQKHIDIGDPKMSIQEIRTIKRRHKSTDGYRERCHIIAERLG